MMSSNLSTPPACTHVDASDAQRAVTAIDNRSLTDAKMSLTGKTATVGNRRDLELETADGFIKVNWESLTEDTIEVIEHMSDGPGGQVITFEVIQIHM